MWQKDLTLPPSYNYWIVDTSIREAPVFRHHGLRRRQLQYLPLEPGRDTASSSLTVYCDGKRTFGLMAGSDNSTLIGRRRGVAITCPLDVLHHERVLSIHLRTCDSSKIHPTHGPFLLVRALFELPAVDCRTDLGIF